MKKNQREKTDKEKFDEMRQSTLELELKARYWKAQHDLRFYTLASEKLQPEYDEWLRSQQEMQAELQKQFEENMAKLHQEGAQIEEKEI